MSTDAPSGDIDLGVGDRTSAALWARDHGVG